jgi:uncharacterized delta-60 repeat protein
MSSTDVALRLWDAPTRILSLLRGKSLLLKWIDNRRVVVIRLQFAHYFPIACLSILPATATPPSIDYPPRSQTVILYQLASFGVSVSGSAPFTYQWRKDGVNIAGATNDELILARAQFSDAGLYSVVVSNAKDSATSTEAALSVNAPAGGDVDCSFACGGSINGGINAVAVEPGGRVVIAGSFSSVNGAARGKVARLHADGSTDFTFMNGLAGISGYGRVNAVALQSDGKVLIGGEFSTVNGVNRLGIARLNRDGSLDNHFLDGLSGVSGWVNALAVQGDGKILMGGYFYKMNGIDRKSLARLNADGTLDAGFLDGLSGITELRGEIAGTIYSIAVQNDGKVLVGGVFYGVNGERRANLARLHSDGTLDRGFLDQLSGADAWITAMAVQTDGQVLIGGPFLSVNGESRRGIARLHADGALDDDFLRGLSGLSSADDPYIRTTSRSAYTLAVQSDGKILIGGRFTGVNDVARTNFARLNSDGTVDEGFKEAVITSYSFVNSVAALPDGKALVAGYFQAVNGEGHHSIAQLNPDGSLDSGFRDGLSEAIYGVAAVAAQSDGKVILGGQFTSINGTGRSNIARLKSDGTLDDGFQDGLSGADGPVQAVALQTDGRALIGGDFSLVNGESRSRLARLNADGSLDKGFLKGLSGANGPVLHLALQSDGKALIQGQFTVVNGESRTNFARLNADGTLDGTFHTGLVLVDTDPDCPDGTVHSIAIQGDSKVLIGGGYVTINGISRTNLARFNPDGTLDQGFQIDFSGRGDSICPNPHGAVYAIAVQGDGKLVVGGSFYSVNGAQRNNLARLNAGGTVDHGFQDGLSGVGGYVYSVALQSDGKILVGGSFSSVNGASRKSVARLNRDGTLDDGFLNGLSGADGTVNWVAPQADGKVLIALGFTTVNGMPVFDVARLWYPLGIQNVHRTGGEVTLTWSAIPNRTYRVQYKEQLSAGTWTDLAGDVAATVATASKTDTTLEARAGGTQRFYQVVLLPQSGGMDYQAAR